ncbi:chlorinating enzyme [Pendulispora albinea]|uniref:Chlorinating enzyme n=1 Tax=Pendulispora albinea TaxID=2741071 RepID=A0ABZ2MB91_9BACT
MLSREDREFFVTNGFLGPFRVYEPAEVKEMWRQVRLQVHDKSRACYPTTDINYDRHMDISILSRHISHPALVERLQGLIGPDVFCWRSEFFPKYPGDAGTEWHQVETYAYGSGIPSLVPTVRREKTPTELTIWTAFTDVPRESGPLKFMPGSHRKWLFDEKRKLERFDGLSSNGGFFGYHFDELKLDPNLELDESQAAVMEMEAGQAVIFTARCMHGSLPNTSRRAMRLGIATRYVPTDVKIFPDQTRFSEHGNEFDLRDWGAVLVAGRDDYEYNRVRTHNAREEPFITQPRVENVVTARICAGGDQWAAG